MPVLVVVLGALIAARSPQSYPEAALPIPADLAAAIRAFDRGQVSNDTATLARLVADDYTPVNSDASVERKDRFLADFMLPGFKIDPNVLEHRIDAIFGDAALVAGFVRLH